MTAPATELPPRVPFLDDRAKARAVSAVKTFESHTSAELVVTVKKHARRYPEIDLAIGVVFAFVALLFLLFFPVEFVLESMPLDVLVAGALGVLLARLLPPITRPFVSKKRREEAVRTAAKAAFYDLGVSGTTGRTGVLVYVALFEGDVAIVADRGVTPEAKKAAEDVVETLRKALATSDMRVFAEALEALGPRFAPTMPRAADDVNELPDEIA